MRGLAYSPPTAATLGVEVPACCAHKLARYNETLCLVKVELDMKSLPRGAFTSGYTGKVHETASKFIFNSLALPFQWSSWLTSDLGDHLPGEILGIAQKFHLRGMSNVLPIMNKKVAKC